MSNQKSLSQQSIEFTALVDSEMEQISGGDKIIQIFNPFAFNDIGNGGSGQQQQQQQQQSGGNGRGNKYGHYKH